MKRTLKTAVVSIMFALLAMSVLALSVSASVSVQPGVSSLHSLAKNPCKGRPTSTITGASGQEVITPSSLTNHGLGPKHPACIANKTSQTEQLTYNGANFGPAIPPNYELGVYIKKPPYGTATFGLAPPASSATWTVTFAK